MGAEIPITMLVTALVGVLLVVCGNYLPKCRRNYTVGIKLPWTLDSDENWNKTHRFAGPVWVVGGILFIATAFFDTLYAGLGVITVMVALPAVYSYSVYRKQSRSK
ncbi:MAG: SdpI family protein, partial [Eubacteriales bacterium]|nr:SdpI family protein [Eubacteriales bacterium]